MDVTVKAVSSFTHGRFNLAKGQEDSMPESMAKDLAKAGLVKLAGTTAAASPEKTVKPLNSKSAPKSGKTASTAGSSAASDQSGQAGGDTAAGAQTKAGGSSADVCTSKAADTDQAAKGE